MNDDETIPELSSEENIQAENELLKLKLQAEFGMGNMDASLNPKMENEWLNDVYNFEEQYAENKVSTVYDFIGQPVFKPADKLTKTEIRDEFNRLMEIMQSKGLRLDAICEYEDEVIYKFITEELFVHEMDVISFPGMMTCFIYEEFHPNHDYDIRRQGDDFVNSLISKKWNEFNNILLADEVVYNGVFYPRNAFSSIISVFQIENKKMKLMQWEIQSLNFNLETKTGEIQGWIEYKTSGAEKPFAGATRLEFKLDGEYWGLKGLFLPGFSA